MSTVSDRTGGKPPGPPDGSDPFRYGWRYVRIVRPDGTEELDQVPLTLEDVLHPEVGDVIVESDPHDSDRGYLKAVSKTRLVGDPAAVVLSDCQVDFNIRGVKPLCPDLAVFFGVRRTDRLVELQRGGGRRAAGAGGRGDLARDAEQRHRDQGAVLPPRRGRMVRDR